MTFLNLALLGGVAAAALPIVIHLFHRSRFQIVPWGAMHLLEAVIRRNMRRMRIEQLILLLVRCAILAFLALAMARPVLTGIRPLLGGAKSSTVVLLDDSYSMDAGGPTQSNAHQARELARQILENVVEGSDVCVIPMAGGAVSEPTFDARRTAGELARGRSGYGSARVADALGAAAAAFGRMHHPHREVVLISDFQRVSWREEEGAARARAADRLRKSDVGAALTFVHVGREVRDNISVESLDFSRMILGVGQKLQVRANLQNHGDARVPDVRVLFRVDGTERAVSQIALGPGERGQVLFTHSFDAPGSHVVEVLAEADPLQADNAFLASIPVWDRVPVLLVSGDPNREPLRGETDFLEIALRPYGSAKADLTDLIIPRVVDVRELDAKALAEARVVLLANVPQLTDAQLRALEEFVREGGGLLIFPGNRINSAWYNAALAGRGLLPLPVVSLAGMPARAAILSQHYDHEALALFNDRRNGDLSDAQVWLWYRLKEDAAVSVLARLDTGDPFLAEKKLGQGRVIQSCLPCDADWSNLPMRPFYLPLMQQLVTYLASKVQPPRNVEAGRPLAAFLPGADAGKRAVLTDPDGKTHEVAVANRGGRGVIEFSDTQRPGLYVLDAPAAGRVHFVVNADRRESDLRQLGEPEIESAARSLGADFARSWPEYRQLEQRRRYGQEIWPALLAATIALIFLEMFLEQLFARRRI